MSKRKPAPRGLKFSQASHRYWLDGTATSTSYVPGMRVAYTLMPAGTQLIIGDET